MKSAHEILSRWLPPIIIMIVIFVVSSFPTLPQIGESQFDVVLKKLAHITEYTLLFCAWLRAINWEKKKLSVRTILFSAILTLLYSFTDEYHQSFVPGRHSTVLDVGFDSIGIFLGVIFHIFYQRRDSQKHKHLLSQSQS
jgi:VanZ family protein